MRKTTIPDGPSIPKIGEGKRGPKGYLGYLLRQAGAAHARRMERALSDLGVTPPQFVVLTMLVAYPGISNAEIARLAMLTPQTVSVIVSNLERSGALERRAHAVHGRIQHLDVTAEGERLLGASRQRVRALEQQLAASLTPDEEQIVRRWLVAVAL
ncbi:MarR family winged helix-turn-helix transcriptional regulator [Variovorax sp. PBL-E5]|uniref:MarR family winged helix-turn-helix transcriptional regulator n=1 Tax=Variovorax sp. PBL-E5 TaxID=434014 RepID=UPI001316BC40|nr:MarR family transcriptional regulator [Variovorax sp. PBL-E5]VTU29249.1 Transcriptional regulator HosA [Variovorax sp. PBL-E5]